MINRVNLLIVNVSLILTSVVGFPQNVESESTTEKLKVTEVVKVQLYYESLCPFCVNYYKELLGLVEELGASVDLQTYPYGNAEMTNESGETVINCQHGEAECYGNKLHACAIDYLQHNASAYVPYINCMMKKGSDDPAADDCGRKLDIDSEPIKTCAKGKKGQELHVWYGQESQKVSYSGVPHVLINGRENIYTNPMWEVCEALKNPPDACADYLEERR